MSFTTGPFPMKGKEAHIIPSYKKGDKLECCKKQFGFRNSHSTKMYNSTLTFHFNKYNRKNQEIS